MLQRVRAGEINGIVVTKLDRLTCSIRNLCELNEDILRPLNVNLVCIRDGINTFEVGSSLLMHLLAVIGQIERENTVTSASPRPSPTFTRAAATTARFPRQDHRAHPSAAKMKIRRGSRRRSVVEADLRVVRRKQPTEIAALLNEKEEARHCERWTPSRPLLLRVNGVHQARLAGSPFPTTASGPHKLAPCAASGWCLPPHHR